VHTVPRTVVISIGHQVADDSVANGDAISTVANRTICQTNEPECQQILTTLETDRQVLAHVDEGGVTPTVCASIRTATVVIDESEKTAVSKV